MVATTHRRADYSQALPPDPGDLDTTAHAERCRQVWAAALAMYVRDARSGMTGHMGASREALADLTSPSAPMLRHLCDVLGWQTEATRAAIIGLLDEGRAIPNGG